ncbi:MAG: hypothetical protein AAF226_12080, partial [Verrucomicrobiota bacterium]
MTKTSKLNPTEILPMRLQVRQNLKFSKAGEGIRISGEGLEGWVVKPWQFVIIRKLDGKLALIKAIEAADKRFPGQFTPKKAWAFTKWLFENELVVIFKESEPVPNPFEKGHEKPKAAVHVQPKSEVATTNEAVPLDPVIIEEEANDEDVDKEAMDSKYASRFLWRMVQVSVVGVVVIGLAGFTFLVGKYVASEPQLAAAGQSSSRAVSSSMQSAQVEEVVAGAKIVPEAVPVARDVAETEDASRADKSFRAEILQMRSELKGCQIRRDE